MKTTKKSKDKTIVLEFVQDAGLANQMFEWATAYSISRELNLPLKWVWRPSKLRDFGLKAFGIEEFPYEEYPMLMLRAGQGSRALRDKAVKLIQESEFAFCGISCPFQNENCFTDHADEIRKIFKLEPFNLQCPEGYTPVAVQVRRGDYVGHPRLNVVTPEYFFGAMGWMRGKVKNPWFFVVSDDPVYCNQTFAGLRDVTVMPPQSPIDGLRTLASCKAHIISNSTFGWWGAWLGEKGPVVVPEYWHHNPGSYGDWNPVPDRWVRLPVGVPQRTSPTVRIKPRSVQVLPDPTIPRAIVIPWNAADAKWHELRYCLRSVEKHFEDKKCPIFVFGTRRPGFILEGGRVQYRGAFTYSEALSNGVQVADKVMWLNDDTIFLKPTTWADCEIPYYVRDADPETAAAAPSQTNPWREGCRQVFLKLLGMGKRDLKIYSTHTPYVWDRKRALKVFEKFGVWEKIPMELAYFHLFPDGSKQLTGERTHELPDTEAQFLNYADRHLTEEFKREIETMFPDFAEWEVKVPF